jgi:hypothetical protein
MMRWHARTALASSFAPTSIVIGGGFFLPFFLPLVLGEDVVLLSGGGGGGASLAFFLRGFGFFAFCGSSPFDMTSMTMALSSSLLPFLLRGGMLSAVYSPSVLLSAIVRLSQRRIGRARRFWQP